MKLPAVRGPRIKRIVMITPSDSLLKQQEIQFANNHWDSFDRGQTGFIQMQELPSLLRHMGIYMQNERLQRYYRLFFGQTLDTMQSNISWDRFQILLSMILRNQTPLYRLRLVDKDKPVDYISFARRGIFDARNLFIEFDSDQSETLSIKQLKEIFVSLGYNDGNQDQFQGKLKEQFALIDKDSNGKIDFDEFVDFYNNLLEIID